MHDRETEGVEVHRLAAFTTDPSGGNPAGVVLTDQALTEEVMQRLAAEVGYSETAFLSGPDRARRRWDVRYFAPESEVPFCGHATIAAGVLLGEVVGPGAFSLSARPGAVALDVAEEGGRAVAALTSVEPSVEAVEPGLLHRLLEALRLEDGALDDAYRPAIADAGARHLVLVLVDRARLAALDYRFEDLRSAMEEVQLTTVALLHRERDDRWHARNPFPTGGVVEDPATGAAAAAFGAYLREHGHREAPFSLEIVQGEDMGRPSRIEVEVPRAGGVTVRGTAVHLV